MTHRRKNHGPSERPRRNRFGRALGRPGKAPGIEPHELPGLARGDAPVTVTCVDYCPEQARVERVDDVRSFLATHRPEWSSVRWIDVVGVGDPTLLRALAEKYELHPLAVEDVVNRGQRPKAEDYPASAEHPGRLFVVVRLVDRVDGNLSTEQVSLFLGRDTVLSFRARGPEPFVPIVQRIETPNSRLRRSDASFLLYCLIDAVVDHSFPLLEEVSDGLEELEEAVFQDQAGRDAPQRLHRMNRELMVLRRVTWPMRDLLDNLHREHHECLSDTTRTYLRDVHDHVVRILDLLETYRELASNLVEMHMVSASNRLGDIVKTLTIISTIFVPLTFLAGVYGMNMPIPENEHAWTYPAFWMVSVGIAGALLYWFRRRDWL
jgi:magnesium transporter